MLSRTVNAVVLCLWLAGTCTATEVRLEGAIFGTTYHITARNSDTEIDATELKAAIENRFAKIDKGMSTWRDDSDVSRFNASEETDWFPVGAETAKVVVLAKEISEQTGGMFDATVAPLVRLWNFGAQSSNQFRPPTEKEITETLTHVGSHLLEVQLDPPALRKKHSLLEVDLSAIAKGYAVDAISELLMDRGFDGFMVEIGGEVRTSGHNQEGSAWRIGIEAPDKSTRKIDSIVPLSDAGMATSGNYRNFHEIEGVTYSHTIDPRTGKSTYSDLTSATVITESCARADAYATAIMAMGLARGKEWAAEHDVQSMLLQRHEGQIQRHLTGGFPLPQTSSDQGTATVQNEFFQLFSVTALVFGVAIAAMAIGSIVANRRLQGSCGGMAGLADEHGKTVCDMCTRPSAECSGNPEEAGT